MKRLSLSFLLCLLVSLLSAQLLNERVQEQIKDADSILFQEGFNNCRTDLLPPIIAKDLEFYHDQSGLTAGRENFINGIENNICQLEEYRPLRKLVDSSQVIDLLYSNGEIYAAIQSGTHEFYAIEEEKPPYLTSTAKFTHLWIRQDSNWILKRVLSYDHKTPNETVADYKTASSGHSDWIKNLMDQHKVPAVGIAILNKHRLQKLAIYGRLDEDQAAPLDALFNVASLTKPIVSILTLQLVEKGLWDLDEPLYAYWVDPDVEKDPRAKLLTTRHILSHQSGFKNWRWEDASGKLQFDFTPGTQFRYSGEGFEYLQHALEAKFNMSLGSLADSILFNPLDMNDTEFHWSNETEEQRFARWHDEEGKPTYEIQKNRTSSAADDLLTTLHDYGHFAEFVLNGAGLSDTLFREMVTPQNGKEQAIKMGLGWEILPQLKGEQYALLHTGGDIGVNALIILLPMTGEGLVIFTNGDNGKKLFFPLTKKYLSLGKEIVGGAQ